MNLYMTSGTPEFMQSIKKKHPNEELFLLHGTGNSVLIHETSNKTVFQVPRKYKVLESVGNFSHNGYFVLQHIPITDEGKTIFEHKYTNLGPTAQKEPGFIALRVLEPIKSETYIILSEWTGPSSYEVWEKTVNLDFSMIADKQNLFTSAPYISTYQSIEEEEAF
ncbi:antibiotic biosynthesis monooxygenase family protein [Psychrobacillus sp. FSL H8-0487]|uniref:antibiotic biosynthesis monooxygenase family protein n=1 Tax=Psychrobacillus sp. FSL H8-0487 TaxID=2921391 RepID=UPI0030F85D30